MLSKVGGECGRDPAEGGVYMGNMDGILRFEAWVFCAEGLRGFVLGGTGRLFIP